MLTLRIDRGGRACVAPPGDAQAWRETDGRLIAWGWRDGTAYWMRFPGLAAYRFTGAGDASDEEVSAVPETDGRDALIADTFERSVLPFALQLRGYEALHASAVTVGGRVVAMCAVSGTGKSTLAWALGCRGHAVWSDDSVVVDVAARPPEAIALPCRVRLRPASASHFGLEEREHVVEDVHAVAPDDAAAVGAGARRPVGRVVVLEQAPGAAVGARRLGPGEALRALLTHAYCLDVADAPRRKAMVRGYLRLIEQVPVVALRFPTGLEHLPDISAAIVAAGPDGG